MVFSLDWVVGHTDRCEVSPEEFVKAVVPGAVQIDWRQAKGTPDWNWEDNYKEYRWMEDCYWVYQAQIPKVELADDEQLLLQCGGIDYQYKVFVGDALLYGYEGMFRPFELDLSAYAGKGGLLRIVVAPVPKACNATPDTREEAVFSCKPAVSYGWDWHPRMVPLGIWEKTELVSAKRDRILEAEVLSVLSGDLSAAEVSVHANVQGGGELLFKLYDPCGEMALESGDILQKMTVENPLLWWCNGYGEPNLYCWELSLQKNGAVVDKKVGKIGFRTITLEMNEGTWDEPEDFPKGRSNAPITVTLNNTPVFAKGSNWVNPEIFPGIMDRDTYLPQLTYAKKANMNLLRIWGGGIVNKDAFFDLCDEFGIMVWQEFMLACNNYIGTPEYLAVLESEAVSIIKRLRGRASLALWCGGNELFNNWSKMTDQSLALRLLNKLCYEHDQRRPFLMTSPMIGMAHGCYTFVYPDGREVYRAMAEARQTAYTEFGMPSVSDMEICLRLSTEDKLFPMVPNDVTISHHAFDAWGTGDTWCGIETLRKYLGEPSSLEQIIQWTQWLQCEGYKCIYEEARRQKPYCSMALNWCYNEPWPTLANNSLLGYPAKPKPAYYAVAQSCRNQLASARIPKFSWMPGEEFSADLWLLNDGLEGIGAGSVDVHLEYNGEKHFLLRWDHAQVPANENLHGPTVRHLFPAHVKKGEGIQPLNGIGQADGTGEATELKLILSAGEMSSEYTLILYL